MSDTTKEAERARRYDLDELSYVLQDLIVARVAKVIDEARRNADLSERACDIILDEANSDQLRAEIQRILSIVVVRAYALRHSQRHQGHGELQLALRHRTPPSCCSDIQSPASRVAAPAPRAATLPRSQARR